MYFCFLSLFLVQSTTENLWITKLATINKKLDPQNTNEKKSWIHELVMRKKEKKDLQNTHEKKFPTHEIPTNARLLDGTRPTGPTMACDSQNLTHLNWNKM